MKNDKFYLQVEGSIGNAMLWWRADNVGFSTNIALARVWTEKEIRVQIKERITNIAWHCKYIDEHTMPVVDMQTVFDVGKLK